MSLQQHCDAQEWALMGAYTVLVVERRFVGCSQFSCNGDFGIAYCNDECAKQ
jgi:hypothetical protein